MSLQVMPQDHKFTPEEMAWLKARNRIEDIRENRKKFPDVPVHATAHKAAPKEARHTTE